MHCHLNYQFKVKRVFQAAVYSLTLFLGILCHESAFSHICRFPKDEGRRQLWVQALKRKDFKPTAHTRLCSKHFEENCFDREKTGGHWLRNCAVPTIFDFPERLKAKRPRLRKPPSERCSLEETSCAESSHNSRKYPIYIALIYFVKL